MRTLTPRIPKSIPKNIPKAALGLVPMLISFKLGISMILGYLAARFFAGSKTAEKGRFPSLIFHWSDYKVHLHHWMLFLGMIPVGFFLDVSSHLFYGFLGGAVIQGVMSYKDWKQIITRLK